MWKIDDDLKINATITNKCTDQLQEAFESRILKLLQHQCFKDRRLDIFDIVYYPFFRLPWREGISSRKTATPDLVPARHAPHELQHKSTQFVTVPTVRPANNRSDLHGRNTSEEGTRKETIIIYPSEQTTIGRSGITATLSEASWTIQSFAPLDSWRWYAIIDFFGKPRNAGASAKYTELWPAVISH